MYKFDVLFFMPPSVYISASIAELHNLLPKMTDDQQFCLRWNDFQTNMVASFKHLRDEKSFCDVTIATEVAFISRHSNDWLPSK